MTQRLEPGSQTPALSLRKLTVAYGSRTIFTDLNLDFAPGRIHGLIGPNGAGKSTLIKAALGLVKATGTVSVNGSELTAMSPRERALAMAYLAQDVPAPAEFIGREVAALGRYARQARFAAHSAEDETAVERALALSGALPWADRVAEATSGGELQLTNLARALAQDAPLLLLDEPASALDMGHQLDVLELLNTWIKHGLDAGQNEQAGPARTVIAVMHDLNEAARFCTDLTLLAPAGSTSDPGAAGKPNGPAQGGAGAPAAALPGSARVIAQGTPYQVLTPELLEAAYRVRADVRINPVTGAPTVTPLGRAAP